MEPQNEITTKSRLFSKKEVLHFAYEKVKTHYGKIFTVILILVFVNIAQSFLQKSLNESGDPINSLLFAFTDIAFAVLELIIGINVVKKGLKIVRGEEEGFEGILDIPENIILYIIGVALSGFLIVVGFIALIIPGIFLALTFCFTKPILIDLKLGPIETLKKGRELTRGHLWELFLFGLVVGLLNIAGAIVFGIGLLLTVPVSFIATLYVYDIFLKASTKPLESTPLL